MNASDQKRETTDRYSIQLEPLAPNRGPGQVSPGAETTQTPAPRRNVTAVLVAAAAALADLIAVAAVIWWLRG
jgi:hypothetical protein